MRGLLVILTGPSGVGKTTVAALLQKEMSSIKKLITYTTRRPREKEVDGIDYHFVSKKVFLGMRKRGELFESARVYDNWYGNRTKDMEELLQTGEIVLIVIDVQGAKTILEKHKDALSIFLTAKTKQVIQERIKSRGSTDPYDLEKRLNTLDAEMLFAQEVSHVIENKEGAVQETVEKIKKAIQTAQY